MQIIYFRDKECFLVDGKIIDYPIGKCFIDFISLDCFDRAIGKQLLQDENPLAIYYNFLYNSSLSIMGISPHVSDIISQYVKATEYVLSADNKDLNELDTATRNHIYLKYVNPSIEQNFVKVTFMNIPLSKDILSFEELNNNNPNTEELVKIYKNIEFASGEVYDVNSISEILYLLFMKMVSSNIKVKRCKCCGKYFIPEGRSDTEYCNRTAPNSIKKCYEIGPIKKYHEKNNNNPILKEFNKVYKKVNARVRLKKISQETFYNWSEEARALRMTAISENWSLEQFINKLNELEV